MCDCDYTCRACMKERKCEPGKYIYIYTHITYLCFSSVLIQIDFVCVHV